MAIKHYKVTVDYEGSKFVSDIPMSDGDYTDFNDGDPYAIQFLITSICEKQSYLAGREFDDTNITIEEPS